MKKTALLLTAAVLLALAAPPARAFTYQGALQAADGTSLKSNQLVEFRIYAAETGGAPLWGRACNVLLDDDGYFNTELDDDVGSALSDAPDAALATVLAANASTPLFLGITVGDSSGEIVPRQALLPVPYANFALDASHASGDFSVKGRATAGSMDISGQAAAGSLDVSGAASVGGNLAVSGTISGYGTAPVGCIVLWSGAAEKIPSGWALCNGQNGTPDLRNRFVVGAGTGSSYAIGDTGGADTVTLSEAQIPSHRHLYAGDDMVDRINGGGYNAADNVATRPGNYDATSSASGSGTVYYTSAQGGGQSHENRPPYYALCYIMRIN